MSFIFTGSSRFYRPERNEPTEAGSGTVTEAPARELSRVPPAPVAAEVDGAEATAVARRLVLINEIDFVTQEALQKKASDILVSCGNLFYRINGRVLPQ